MHMKRRKLFLAILVLLELILLAILFLPRFPNSQSFNKAFYEWIKNPSPKTEAIVNKESARLRRADVIFDGVIIALLCLNTIGIIMAWKHKRI